MTDRGHNDLHRVAPRCTNQGRPSWLVKVDEIRSVNLMRCQADHSPATAARIDRHPALRPIDPAEIDATYRRWGQVERKQFADRVDALEASGLDIDAARDQAFRELTNR